MFKLRWGPSAFVVSLLALILSLGGASFAVTQAGDTTAAKPAAHSKATLPKWHKLTLLNGWKHSTGGTYVPAYFKDSDNVIHLRGGVTDGALGHAVFRLPRGVRPRRRIDEPVSIADSTAGTLVILRTGTALLIDDSNGTQSQSFTSLDGVTFRAP